MNIVYLLCVLYLQFSNSFALPNVNGCMIEEDSGTSVGTPTTDRESETTYSCVVPHNCTYEIHVIGNYESSNGLHGLFYRRRPGNTNVYLRVTGQSSRPLILVLSSYEPVKWRLYSSVNIDRVILTGYYGSTVSVSSASIGQTEHMTGREHPNYYSAYGSDSGGGSTRRLLLYLQQRFGPVSSFSGSYRADRWDLNINRAVEDGETCSFSTPSTPYTTPPPPVLVDVGGCMVQKLSGTSVGLPTTFGAPEVTYSCVVPNNCTHEIHVIGNYESSDGVNGFYVRRQAGDTDVYLTVSGQSSRPLILVLSSYEPVRWRLHGRVPINRVIMTGYYGSTIISDATIGQRENLTGPGHPNGYSAYGSNSGSTRRLLLYLQQRFGPVSSFSGSYRADRWDLNINREPGAAQSCSALLLPPSTPSPPSTAYTRPPSTFLPPTTSYPPYTTDDSSEPDTSMPALVPVVTAISLTIVIGTFVIILCCILIKQRRRSVTYHQSRHPAVVVPTTTTQPLSPSIVPQLPTPPTAPVKESSFSAVSDPPPDYYIALNHPSVNNPPPYPTQ